MQRTKTPRIRIAQLVTALLAVFLIQRCGSSRFNIQEARAGSAPRPATFDQVFEHAYARLLKATKGNENAAAVFRAAAFFAEEISGPVIDESEQVDAERKHLYELLAAQTYRFKGRPALWWDEFALLAPPQLLEHVAGVFEREDPFFWAYLQEKRPAQKTVSFETETRYTRHDDIYTLSVDFRLIRLDAFNQIRERYKMATQNFQTSDVARGNPEFDSILEDYPYDCNLYVEAGWRWFHASSALPPRDRLPLWSMAGKYLSTGSSCTNDKPSVAAAQLGILSAQLSHVRGNSQNAEWMLKYRINLNHLDKYWLWYYEQLYKDVTKWVNADRAEAEAQRIAVERAAIEAKIREREKLQAQRQAASSYYNSSSSLSTTPSGPGNTRIINNDMRIQTYTDSHGNKVYQKY